jgi:SAM-dependent methyltransferase
VKNTFGSLQSFEGKLIVDAGGGSGMQSRWMAEAGASHIICLELSHSVDGIMKRNFQATPAVDVVQCSIDNPPIKANSIDGLVICHNVIQHTPSVSKTAHALWNIVGPGGEFAFNCYARNDEDFIRAIRYRLHALVRDVVSKRSFRTRMAYAKTMAALRFLPLLGYALEKSNVMFRGPIPRGPDYFGRAFWQAALDTFDEFGAHSYQHYVSHEELKTLVERLPGKSHVLNLETYFARPPLPGCALRVFKST